MGREAGDVRAVVALNVPGELRSASVEHGTPIPDTSSTLSAPRRPSSAGELPAAGVWSAWSADRPRPARSQGAMPDAHADARAVRADQRDEQPSAPAHVAVAIVSASRPAANRLDHPLGAALLTADSRIEPSAARADRPISTVRSARQGRDPDADGGSHA
jgi:hypothetical protein